MLKKAALILATCLLSASSTVLGTAQEADARHWGHGWCGRYDRGHHLGWYRNRWFASRPFYNPWYYNNSWYYNPYRRHLGYAYRPYWY